MQAENAAYAALVAGRAGSDIYAARAAQTFNDAQKHKEVSTQGAAAANASTQATTFNIHDAQAEAAAERGEGGD